MGYWRVLHKLDRLAGTGVNPDRVSWLSVIVSAVFVFWSDILIWAAALAVIVALDWLDGAVARNLHRKNGRKLEEVTDVGCDRVSELLVFSAFPLLIPLVAINIFLSAQRLRVDMPIVMPLRQLLLLYLLGVIVGVLPNMQHMVMLW